MNPAPMVPIAPRIDHTISERRPMPNARATMPMTMTANSRPSTTWSASATAPCAIAQSTLRIEPLK